MWHFDELNKFLTGLLALSLILSAAVSIAVIAGIVAIVLHFT